MCARTVSVFSCLLFSTFRFSHLKVKPRHYDVMSADAFLGLSETLNVEKSSEEGAPDEKWVYTHACVCACFACTRMFRHSHAVVCMDRFLERVLYEVPSVFSVFPLRPHRAPSSTLIARRAPPSQSEQGVIG
jgi:hypothetical protein